VQTSEPDVVKVWIVRPPDDVMVPPVQLNGTMPLGLLAPGIGIIWARDGATGARTRAALSSAALIRSINARIIGLASS